MQKKVSKFIPIALIVVFAFFLRFWMIGSVVPGISIDEVEYTITAKSYFLTGTDLVNKTNPLDVLRFVYPPTDAIKAELPYLIDMLSVGYFSFSLPMARLPFVLFGLGTVILLYKTAEELFDRKTGIIAGVLGAINPFLVLTGRTMYEIVPATFFFMLGFYLLIKLKGYKILFSIPVFTCAFYAYIGTKLLFAPFILLASFFGYYYVKKRKDGKYYLAVSIFAIFFVILFVGLLRLNNSGGRMGELFTPNSPQIAKAVDLARRDSIATPLTPLIFNKGTMYVKALVDSFYINFSSAPLFIYSDGFFRLYNFGVFYYIDALFILAGLFFIFSKKKILAFFLSGFILITTIPQVFHTGSDTSASYTHTVLLFPFLIIITAGGIINLISSLPKGKIQYSIATIVVILYAFSLLTFFQIYFYQYPLIGKDDFPSRLMSRYITFAKDEGKSVIVMTPDSGEKFKKYIFYSDAMSKDTIQEIKQGFITGNRHLGNISFISCMEKPDFPKNTVVIEDALCGKADFMQRTTIPLILDGGTAYKIYQDSVCSKYSLKQYPSDLTLTSLNVENLSKKQFCETFITQ